MLAPRNGVHGYRGFVFVILAPVDKNLPVRTFFFISDTTISR